MPGHQPGKCVIRISICHERPCVLTMLCGTKHDIRISIIYTAVYISCILNPIRNSKCPHREHGSPKGLSSLQVVLMFSQKMGMCSQCPQFCIASQTQNEMCVFTKWYGMIWYPVAPKKQRKALGTSRVKEGQEQGAPRENIHSLRGKACSHSMVLCSVTNLCPSKTSIS